jgi:hypothetical protein
MIELLAFTIPGMNIDQPPGFNQSLNSTGAVVGGFLNIAFMIAGFLLLVWLVWGVMQYIFAGGNKEGLARARARITWALVGFVVVVLAFLVSGYAKDVLEPKTDIQVTNVDVP